MKKNKKLSKRGCPICNNKFCTVLHNQSFILPEKNTLPSNYDLVCCEKCGFIYADVSANQSDYDFYYKKLSKYEDKNIASGTGINIFDKKRLEETAKEIDNLLINKSESILDFGCGNGGLLLELKKRGYKKLKGIDPSIVCVDNIRKNGINASVGSIFDYHCEEKFDLIIFTHVFEHILDLQSIFNKITPLLNRNGKLYIETPDASRYHKFYKVPYYYFDIEHINHFNKNSLINLLKINNFKNISSGEKEFLFSFDELYPAVWVLGQKTKIKKEYKKDTFVKKSILKYIQMSQEINRNRNILKELREIRNSQEEIIVWGAGSYTMRMLANSDLGKCNIKFFVDKDSKKQILKIGGKKIYSPKKIYNFSGTIIIASAIFSSDIKKEILKMGLNNKLIFL